MHLAFDWNGWGLCTPFLPGENAREEFKVVLLPTDTSFSDALQRTKLLGERAFGLVETRRGLAIRVKRQDFDEGLKLVRPDDHESLAVKLYEVSGLPCWMGRTALARFCGAWSYLLVTTFRTWNMRTWIVRAKEAPAHHLKQHADGLAVFKEAVPKPMKNVTVERWKGPAPLMPSSTVAKSYAQMAARPSPDKKPTAKPVGAPAAQLPVAPSPASAAPVEYVGSDTLAQLMAQIAALTQAVNAGQVTMSALQADIVRMKSEFSGEEEALGDTGMVTDASASDPFGKGGKNGKGKSGHGAAPY